MRMMRAARRSLEVGMVVTRLAHEVRTAVLLSLSLSRTTVIRGRWGCLGSVVAGREGAQEWVSEESTNGSLPETTFVSCCRTRP